MAIRKKIYKSLEYYLDLPWTYTIERDMERGKPVYVIYVNELPGVCTDARTIEEAMKNIKEAIEGAVNLYMKNEEEIPVPIDEEKFKGNIAYRTSNKRHYLLAKESKRRGISLSQFIDECVDTGISAKLRTKH